MSETFDRLVEQVGGGFQFPWAVGCGGSETPFTKDGKRYLYVWNCQDRKHYYYCYDTDIFILDKDFHNV
jgi:hypothetical protein